VRCQRRAARGGVGDSGGVSAVPGGVAAESATVAAAPPAQEWTWGSAGPESATARCRHCAGRRAPWVGAGRGGGVA